MEPLKRYETLRFKLAATAVFLVVIPLSLAFVMYTNTVKDIITQKYTDTATQSVFETAEKIDLLMNDLMEYSTVVISDRTFLEMVSHPNDYMSQDFNDQLRGFLKVRDDLESIELVAQDAYYSIGANKIDDDLALYQKLIDSDGEAVWIPTKVETIEILSSRFNKWYFTLGRKVIDYNTLEDYGYILFSMDEQIFSNAYRNLIDDSSAQLMVINESGRVVSHSQKDLIDSTILFEAYANNLLNESDRGYFKYKDEHNVENVVIYATLENSGWKLVKTISTDSLYREMNRIQGYLAGGGLLYSIGIIAYFIYFSYNYTEPILNMKKTMKLAEKGNLNVRTQIHTRDEIGQLGDGLNKLIHEMQELINRLVEEEQSKKELELEALHAQINPHFLYNTLNTIKWMAKIQGNLSVDKAITALIKLLRVSIDLSQEMIPLSNEVDYVRNFMVIQRLRFNESIDIQYDLDPDVLGISVPKLILQPIVENAIIYGLEDGRENLHIQIRAFKSQGRVAIEVLDDGPGIAEDVLPHILVSEDPKNRFSKVGLRNVNQRIKLYLGSECGLEIHTELGQGTKVTAWLS